jgi:hypothetical protein
MNNLRKAISFSCKCREQVLFSKSRAYLVVVWDNSFENTVKISISQVFACPHVNITGQMTNAELFVRFERMALLQLINQEPDRSLTETVKQFFFKVVTIFFI